MFQFPAFNTEVNTFKVFDKWGRGDYNCCVRKIPVTEILCVGGVVRYHWQTVNCTYLNYRMFAFWYSTMKPSPKSRQWTYPSPANTPSLCPLVFLHSMSFPAGPHKNMTCFLSMQMNLLFPVFCINGITQFGIFLGGLAFFIQHIHFDIYLHCCVYQ